MLDHNSKRVDNPEINIVASGHGALASLKGRIDMDSSPAVRDQLIGLLHAPHHPDLDCSGNLVSRYLKTQNQGAACGARFSVL